MRLPGAPISLACFLVPVTLERSGDLLASPAQVIVNAVNCRGVMGKGVAALFRGRAACREMAADYEKRCAAGEISLAPTS